MSMFDDIAEFHKKFGHEYTGPPRILSDLENKFRVLTMYEEWKEYCDAVMDEDKAEMFDALIDLVYFSMGTAYLHGFDWDTGWRRVHEANMRKVRANSAGDSKRGSQLDVVKPDGWTPPNLEDLV